MKLTDKEEKILRKALDKVTPEDEASNGGSLFVKSARKRGIGPYDLDGKIEAGGGFDTAIARWWAAKKKPIILTIAALYFVAGVSGGVWLFMPHEPEVRRATLLKLPPPHYAHARHSTKHRAAASISRKDKNS
jgi:hypothetical protein